LNFVNIYIWYELNFKDYSDKLEINNKYGIISTEEWKYFNPYPTKVENRASS